MRREVLYFLLVSLALFAGCTSAGNGSETAVEFEVLETPNYSPPADRSMDVVRSEQEWQELWADSDAEPPAVDFEQKTVLAVHMGEQSTGGHAIGVTKVTVVDGTVVVDVEAVSPGEGCFVTQALTRPYQMVTISATDRPVAFNVVEETRQC